MDKKKLILPAVCLSLIAAVAVYRVRRETEDVIPDKVAGQLVPCICGACGYEAGVPVVHLAKTRDRDRTTGFRKCPKCGAYRFYTSIECDVCGETIPNRPFLVVPPEIANTPRELPWIEANERIYICPKCGGNARASWEEEADYPPSRY